MTADTAFRNASACHGKARTLRQIPGYTRCAYPATITLSKTVDCTMFNAAAFHNEFAAASLEPHAATIGKINIHQTAYDASTHHAEGAAFNTHTAAARALAAADLTADNISSLHCQFAAIMDIHATAIWGITSCDNAAGDIFRTIYFIRYPQAVTVRGKMVRSRCITVLNRQHAATSHRDNAALDSIIFIFEYMAVQVKSDGMADNQRGVDGNVCHQLDSVICTVFQRRGQFCRCRHLCYTVCSQHSHGQPI